MPTADEIFKGFREHSIAEFFKKNRQMLGYAGMVRSLVTVVHEYMTNSLDACEEAGILPDINVKVSQITENRYNVVVRDNGSGIPKKYVGKALAMILTGTKFHRHMQQRGQQGIGAAGCTLFSQVTTGKPVHVRSYTSTAAFECELSIDTAHNKPVVSNIIDIDCNGTGIVVEGEFAGVKYENSEHGVLEYIKRTALANPQTQISFSDPFGKEYIFVRSSEKMPERPKTTKPHPLGLSVNDLLELAQASESRKLSSFMVESLARTTPNKLEELQKICSVDLGKDPKELTWSEAEELVKAIQSVKWVAPDSASVIGIGADQIKIALKNILNPDFISVVERKPQVFKGGIPFMVEVGIAYGGNSGRQVEDTQTASIMRFANRVPLMFDSGSCAITEAVRDIQWKRYSLDIDTQPISVFVNISSVYIPYAGVGKEAIAQEDEIVDEIKLALMEAARSMQRYVRGRQLKSIEENKYKTIMRYTKQLATDLEELTSIDKKEIEERLEKLVAKHYPKLKQSEGGAQEAENLSGSDGA